MKLSKQEAAAHREAVKLAHAGRPLTESEKHFVLDHFHPGAEHINSVAGAFFTPRGLARDLAIEVPGCRSVIDLCAGIGALAFELRHTAEQLVCVEVNPDYLRIGQAVVPEATWVLASVFEIEHLRRPGGFDVAVSNPPFGNIPGGEASPGRYTGRAFDLKVVEVASRLARYGVFILPQGSVPFQMSGIRGFREQAPTLYTQFQRDTGIALTHGCGVDTAIYADEWRGAKPKVEIAIADFEAHAAEEALNPQDVDQLRLDLAA